MDAELFQINHFLPFAKSAREKVNEKDLTDDERAAIAFFADVPWSYKNGKMVFAPFGLIFVNGTWTAICEG